MDKQILVPMKRSDRVEDLIPYVEKVSRPGMRVIFMVPYPIEGFRWMEEEWGRKGIEQAVSLANYYRWDTHLQKAKDLIASSATSLTDKGIDVAVDLYAGSIRSAVKDYAAKGDVHLIVTRPGFAERIAGFFNGSNSLLDLFQRPALPPVLLIYPKVG